MKSGDEGAYRANSTVDGVSAETVTTVTVFEKEEILVLFRLKSARALFVIGVPAGTACAEIGNTIRARITITACMRLIPLIQDRKPGTHRAGLSALKPSDRHFFLRFTC